MGLDLKGLLTGGASKLLDSAKGIISEFKLDPAQAKEFEEKLTIETNRHLEAIADDAQKQYESELKDNADARNREIQIAISDKSPLLNKIISPLLALLILGSCFLMWYIIMFKDIPKEKETLVAGIVGSLTTISMGVVGYYFGSSAGSANKQKQLEKLMDK